MPLLHDQAASLAARVRDRTAAVVHGLTGLDEAGLRAPSRLPGWTRLTVACHLRYGAAATRRMTADALEGRPTAFYPGGRSRQREATLAPAPGESPADVVAGLREESEALDRTWRGLSPAAWATAVVEPAGNTDLGRVTVAFMALLRLTEVEVHGTDLDLGLGDWSDLFVSVALPSRLDWLNRRRPNREAVDPLATGSWLLVPSDGPAWLVAVDAAGVHSVPAERSADADATIAGSNRDLLAWLLGRPTVGALAIGGDRALADAFHRACPAP
jgi:maleylpyruvate isomerase